MTTLLMALLAVLRLLVWALVMLPVGAVLSIVGSFAGAPRIVARVGDWLVTSGGLGR